MVNLGSVAAGGASVSIVIRAIDDFSKEFHKAEKSLSGLDKFSKGLTGSLVGLGAAGVGAAIGIGKLAIDAGDGIQVGQAFNNMFGGEAPAALDRLRVATQGTVNDIDLMRQANQAMLLGIDTNALPAMFEGAFAASQATGRPVADAIADVTTGIGRQSKLILDNLGIMVDAEGANDTYAASIGKVASELTEEEKKAAFTAATMEALAANTERIGEIQDNTSLATQRAAAEFDNLKQTIGERFAPILTEAFTNLTPLIEEFSVMFMDQVVPAIEMAFEAFTSMLNAIGGNEEGLSNLVTVLGYVMEGLFTFFALVFKGIETIVGFGKAVQEWADLIRTSVRDHVLTEFNRLKILIETLGLVFTNMSLLAQIAFELIKLGALTVANVVIDAFEGMANRVIDAVNAIISTYNRVASEFGFDKIEMLAGVSFGRFDTSAIEGNIQTLRGEAAANQEVININIETLTGMDPEAVAEALKQQLNDLVGA